MDSHLTRWLCSLVVSFISSTLACAFSTRWTMLLCSSFAWPCAVAFTVSHTESKAFATSLTFCSHASTAASIFRMWSSDGRSSPRGVVRISAFSTSTSATCNAVSCSCMTTLALHSLSPIRATLRCSWSSFCMPLTLDCNFWSSCWNAVPALLSLTFVINAFRDSAQAVPAAFSASSVSSVAAFNLSASSFSASSARNGAEASAVRWSFASASATFCVTSRSWFLVSRLAVSFWKAKSFFPTSSTRDCRFAISSAPASRVAAGKHLTTADLALRKVFALSTAAWQPPAACLQAARAAEVSSSLNISMPMRNGPSASLVLSNASSADCAFSPPSLRIACNCMPSS
mmetsp:Transcript_41316/g.124690  ORF Transcript_41316/g.124690 Transcript_41316/m.124690 type:complete len:344 (+) Transcript_41316:3407-4438(+)